MKYRRIILALALAFGAAPVAAQEDYLRGISLDSLLHVQVSSASRYSQDVMDAPAVITVISAEEIARYGDRTLDQVLSRVAGFYLSYDRNYSYIGVRGFSRPTDYNNRLVLLLNGRVLNEPFYGSAAFGSDMPIDLSAVDHIEVLRGPSSALYGAGAMLALVNVVTRRAEDATAAVSGEAGSAGLREASLHLGGIAEGVDGIIAARIGRRAGEDLHYAEYDEPSTNDGVAEDLDWDEYASVMANAGVRGIRMQLLATQRRKGIPTGAWGMTFNDPRAETTDRHYLAELSYERELNEHARVAAAAWYRAFDYHGAYPSQPLFSDLTETRSVGADIHGTIDITAANRVVAGLEVVRNHRADYASWYPDTADFAGDFPLTTAALYVQDEQDFGARLTVTAGARVDFSSEVSPAVSPRLALVYHWSDELVLKLLAAKAFRAPNSYEREYRSAMVIPAAGLRSEEIRTLELAAEHAIAHMVIARVSAFTYEMDRLIDSVERPDGAFTFVNSSGAGATGAELGITLERAPLSAYLRYTALATHVHGADVLSNAPSHLLKAGAALSLGPHLAPAVDLQYSSARLTLQGAETGAGVLLNSVVRVRNLGPWSAGLRVRNLFNTGVAYPGGYEHLQDAIEQDGRELSLFAEYRWR